MWAVVKVKSHGEGVPWTKVIRCESERPRGAKRPANESPKSGEQEGRDQRKLASRMIKIRSGTRFLSYKMLENRWS